MSAPGPSGVSEGGDHAGPAIGPRRHAPGRANVRLLVPRRHVFRVWRHLQRPGGSALHPPRSRSRLHAGRRRRRARGHGPVQLHRDDRQWLADGPLGPTSPAPHLLQLPWREPAVPSVHPRHAVDQRVRHPVRARLHRHRAADRGPGRGPVWQTQRRCRLRLDLRRAHAGGGDRGVGCRDRPGERRRLCGSVRGRRLDRDHRRVCGTRDRRARPATPGEPLPAGAGT